MKLLLKASLISLLTLFAPTNFYSNEMILLIPYNDYNERYSFKYPKIKLEHIQKNIGILLTKIFEAQAIQTNYWDSESQTINTDSIILKSVPHEALPILISCLDLFYDICTNKTMNKKKVTERIYNIFYYLEHSTTEYNVWKAFKSLQTKHSNIFVDNGIITTQDLINHGQTVALTCPSGATLFFELASPIATFTLILYIIISKTPNIAVLVTAAPLFYSFILITYTMLEWYNNRTWLSYFED